MPASTSKPRNIAPLDAVLLSIVLVTVGGGSLLLSSAESTTLVDGARPWGEDSFLRALVRILCLDYQFPTVNADEVKNFLLAIGAGLAALVLGLAITIRPVAAPAEDGWSNGETDGPTTQKLQITPVAAAQLLFSLFLMWSYASNGWSAAPEVAVGGTILLAISFLWSLCIGHGFGRQAARAATRIIIGITGFVSIIALAYYYGRNPVLRAKFPYGNPSFLSACLIPGLLLSISLVPESLAGLRRPAERVRALRSGLAALIVLVLGGWAFCLADTRGAYIGLAAGFLAMVFFAVPRRVKWLPIVLTVGLGVAGWSYFSAKQNQSSPTGRSETIRLRTYAWSYAEQMFNERPLTGHGQGGFVLAGDERATKDVLADPLVFDARITHAHNEWLEIMADLGAVGIVLIAGALILTLMGGMQALKNGPFASDRWTLIGLLSIPPALIVEESFGVGLRVAGVATYFYTVLGLIWSYCRPEPSPLIAAFSRAGWRRAVAGVTSLVIAALVLRVGTADFLDARNAFRVEQLLRDGKYDEAIERAVLAADRLNPQRRLEGLYRLSEAHMLVASTLQARADEREARARETEVPNAGLLELAQKDRILSDEHCRGGSVRLRELVQRSPGFLNHGWVAFRLNMVQAHNAEARGERQQRDEFLAAAIAAIGTELERQPFEPILADSLMRAGYGVLPLPKLIEVLARPLRYHRVAVYSGLLRELSSDTDFVQGLSSSAGAPADPAIAEAIEPSEASSKGPDPWLPEARRLAAAVSFLRGEYDIARAHAEAAVRGYAQFGEGSLLGAAAAQEELAHCCFLNDPEHPQAALDAAERAIRLAPDSEPGRNLKATMVQQMVQYHLAKSDEAKARLLLAETGAPGIGEDAISREMGLRYRQLCQMFLLRRRDAGVLPKPVTDLLPKLQSWIERALELNPTDPAAHFLAADLAFHVGNDEATALHLRSALEAGLPPNDVLQFLSVTREKRPESAALNALWNELQSRFESSQPPS